MKNLLECPNCKSLNPNYRLVCNNCKAYLRERVFNIDFWAVFWGMFESPISNLKKIIFAEHKNFFFITLLLLSIKFSINTFLLANIFIKDINLTTDVLVNLLFLLVTYLLVFSTYSVLITYFYKIIKVDTRIKDNFALIVFSQSAILFSLFIIFPVELGVFGIHWFVFNPSPFLIKSNIAYGLIAIEVILLLWGLVQVILAHYVQIKSVILSLVLGIIFYIVIFLVFLFFPFQIS